MAEPMNDLSAFDGDAERERQICDWRVKGKSEAEVCQMLGVTVPDIHRALVELPRFDGRVGLRQACLGHDFSFRIRWAKDTRGPSGGVMDCRSLQ